MLTLVGSDTGTLHCEPGEGPAQMLPLCHLGVIPITRILTELIRSDQLVASPCGGAVATIRVVSDCAERVTHSAFTSKTLFQRQVAEHSGPRILMVSLTDVLVWGCPVGGHPGIWLLSDQGSRLLAVMDSLSERLGAGQVALETGSSPLYPGDLSVLTEAGLWPVAAGTRLTAYLSGELCIVERLGERLYAYELVDGQVNNFVPLSEPDMQVLDIVRWRGKLLVIYVGENSSLIREVSSSSDPPYTLKVSGQIQRAWSSPGGESLLTLVRPPGIIGGLRKLYLNHGSLVHAGDMRPEDVDVYWSQDGCSVAVQVPLVLSDARVVKSLISSRDRRVLPLGVTATEVLVNDDGALSAMVLTDGVQFEAKMLTLGKEDTSSLIWNLHMDDNGHIIFNTVEAGRVLRLIYDNSQPRHQAA